MLDSVWNASRGIVGTSCEDHPFEYQQGSGEYRYQDKQQMKGTGGAESRPPRLKSRPRRWRRYAGWAVLLLCCAVAVAVIRPTLKWQTRAAVFQSGSLQATPTVSAITSSTQVPTADANAGNPSASGSDDREDSDITGSDSGIARSGVANAPAVSSGDWPMYGRDASRTNYNPSESTLSPDNVGGLAPHWQANIGTGIAPTSSAPSVAGGRVYVGSSVTSGSNFYAFDAVTGAVAWTASLGPSPTCFSVGIGATSAISGSIIVAGGADAAYYGLDSATGNVLWRYALNAGPSAYAWASPLILGDRAYIGISSGCDNPSVRGEIRAVSLLDGTLLSSRAFVPDDQAGAGIWNSPALTEDGRTLVVSTGEDYGGYNGPYNRAIVALDPLSLLILQAHQQGPLDKDSDYATTPVIFHDSSGRTLVAANHKDENFYAYDLDHLDDGPIWYRQTGSIVGMMPGYDPTMGSGGTLFFMDGLGNLHGVDPATGLDLWTPAPAGTAHGNMAIANGMVFLNTGAGGLRVIAEKDGRSLATFVPDNAGKAYSGVAVSNGFVFWLSGSYLNAWSLP